MDLLAIYEERPAVRVGVVCVANTDMNRQFVGMRWRAIPFDIGGSGDDEQPRLPQFPGNEA